MSTPCNSPSPAEIAAALRRPPVHTIAETEATTGAPGEPGLYAWWAVPDAVPGMPAIPHPSEPLGLLYVGIAPSNAASAAQLRSRLCGQHIGGNIGSSTFRFGLGALLWESEGWTPRRSASGKYTLDRDDNDALSVWQRDHLRLRWVVVTKPWCFESTVIATMKPPMNREHNQDHPFYDAMGRARAGFREAARQLQEKGQHVSAIENEWHAEMVQIYDDAKAIGYPASRFIQMV